MIVSSLAIYKTSGEPFADGTYYLLAPAGTPLREGQASTQLPAGFSEATFTWNRATKAMVEDPAKVEAVLIALVKAENERLVKSVYSQNYGKQKKYSRKQQELLDYRALTPVLGTISDVLGATLAAFVPSFNGLTAAARKKKFRFAMAQAAKRGVAIDVIFAEIEKAIDTTEDMVANWEATELEAIRAIKAASTAAAKRAAYAAINWSWTAS